MAHLPSNLPATIWIIATAASGEAVTEPGNEILSDAERSKARRFARPEDAKLAECSYVLQRRILGALLNSNPRELRIERSQYGRPYLSSDATYDEPASRAVVVAPSLDWNTSHDRGVVAVALIVGDKTPPSAVESDYLNPGESRNCLVRVGLDIMKLEVPSRHKSCDSLIAAVANQFSPAEQAWLKPAANKAEAEQILRFFAIWTSKEAFLKAVGTGITNSLKDLEISPLDNNAWNSLTAASMPGLNVTQGTNRHYQWLQVPSTRTSSSEDTSPFQYPWALPSLQTRFRNAELPCVLRHFVLRVPSGNPPGFLVCVCLVPHTRTSEACLANSLDAWSRNVAASTLPTATEVKVRVLERRSTLAWTVELSFLHEVQP